MLRILQDFESAVSQGPQLSPLVLVGPGLVLAGIGLFIWLGGVGFRKLLITVAGVVIGGVCGFFLVGHTIVSTILAATLFAAIAMLFERLFISILTGTLAVMIAFAVISGSYIEDTQGPASINTPETPTQDSILSPQQSAEKMEIYITDIGQKIKHACLQMPVLHCMIIMALALISIAAGFLFRRLASALCFSFLGTVLIFAGMILLLLYKGAVPVRIISSKQSYYAIVFVVMVAFGTLEQLLLCKHPKAGPTVTTENNKQEPNQAKKRWRTT